MDEFYALYRERFGSRVLLCWHIGPEVDLPDVLVPSWISMPYSLPHSRRRAATLYTPMCSPGAKEKEALELQNLMEREKLQQLRSQINPHFLFNTLNVILYTAQMVPVTRHTSTTALWAWFSVLLSWDSRAWASWLSRQARSSSCWGRGHGPPDRHRLLSEQIRAGPPGAAQRARSAP